MRFTKDSKKYYFDELKHSITNSLKFNIKSLQNFPSLPLEAPLLCPDCSRPTNGPKCPFCGGTCPIPELNENDQKIPQSYVYREKVGQMKGQKIDQGMILCVDLSGSMCWGYKSKYKKVNEQFVSMLLGPKNYQILKKRLGAQKVLKNYQMYQMLLEEGDSVKSICEMVKMSEMSESHKTSQSAQTISQQNLGIQPQINQYISRKQIIQITVSKLINIMKSRHPDTFITVVYFNNFIQIPIDSFSDKLLITQIQTKTVQQMVLLGQQYSSKISKSRVGQIGQNLVMNLTKASQNGSTAMGPALAFCCGLAKSFKYSLNQIVVITDGMSNIGFGQTEDETQHEQTLQLYKNLALQYAKPLNCVVNVITFEDCCIGYECIDQTVEITGGIPCQIQFTKIGGETVVDDQTFNNISFKAVTSFSEYPSQLCFNTKTLVVANNPNVILKVQKDLQPFVKQNKGNFVLIETGIRSSSLDFVFQFSVPEELAELQQNSIKFTIFNQYFRNNKKNISITTDKIKVIKGTKQQAQKQQLQVIQKQIKETLKYRQIFEEDMKKYENLSTKIEEDENLSNNLDKDLVQKFKAKMQKLDDQLKHGDKLTRQKITMKSRAQKTFKANHQDLDDDGFV